jgi:hypothetical protein
VPDKQYYLRADEIQPLVQNVGGCFATDMITVHGHKVGFMYREEPEFDADSGWRFLAGNESQEYLDDPTNLAIYAVNTIANHDADIIPYLHAPIGSAFEREGGSGNFVEITGTKG